MPSGYHHLGYHERCQIYALRKSGESVHGIAAEIGRAASTVSRELKRNSGGRGYRHRQAQQLSEDRRSLASSRPRKMTPDLWSTVEDLLRGVQWSPEQIAGRLRLEGVVSVSTTWIYRHVRADRSAGGDLHRHLRHRGKKYNRRSPGGAGRGVIPNRVDISERPAIVEEKSRVGDWEVDTIVGGRHRGALVSVVDRASKYTFLEGVVSRSSALVGGAVCAMLAPVKAVCHTITADNGKEFAGHQVVSEALNTGFYFATPYHSWERGLNEATNGLVRQYFPKGTDFHEVDAAAVRRVQDLLNHRPRRALGFRTPAEVFGQALKTSRVPLPDL